MQLRSSRKSRAKERIAAQIVLVRRGVLRRLHVDCPPLVGHQCHAQATRNALGNVRLHSKYVAQGLVECFGPQLTFVRDANEARCYAKATRTPCRIRSNGPEQQILDAEFLADLDETL